MTGDSVLPASVPAVNLRPLPVRYLSNTTEAKSVKHHPLQQGVWKVHVRCMWPCRPRKLVRGEGRMRNIGNRIRREGKFLTGWVSSVLMAEHSLPWLLSG